MSDIYLAKPITESWSRYSSEGTDIFQFLAERGELSRLERGARKELIAASGSTFHSFSWLQVWRQRFRSILKRQGLLKSMPPIRESRGAKPSQEIQEDVACILLEQKG